MRTDPALDELHKEHRTLRSGLHALAQLVELDPGAMDRSQWWAGIHGQLLTIRSFLEPHFVGEERGVYQVVAMERPALGRRLGALADEHRALMARLIMLVKLAGCEDSVESMRHETCTWIRLLSEHERSETRLLQEALVHDIGSPD